MLDLSTDYLILSLVLILLWEQFYPREVLSNSNTRWKNNFSLYLVNFFIKWFLFITLSVLFNYEPVKQLPDLTLVSINIEDSMLLILSILVLDFLSYIKHRFFHRFQVLWRTHLVHHSDICLDVTTNFRHHPFEELLSFAIYSILLFILQLPVWAVAIYGVSTGVMQLWHHSNTKLAIEFDQLLRWIIITPSLHKLHHSSVKMETNSNYGTLFSCWDRCFGTLCQHPQKNRSFSYGLEYFREKQSQSLWATLKQPISYKKGQVHSNLTIHQPNTD